VTQPLSAQLVPAARCPEGAPATRPDFGDFYERWHNQLLDYVRTTCGFRDAEEITQETMARALVNLDLSSDHGRQWRWLRVVARNVATDLGRARRAGSPDRGVDLLRVQAPRFLEERLAAVALLGLDDS